MRDERASAAAGDSGAGSGRSVGAGGAALVGTPGFYSSPPEARPRATACHGTRTADPATRAAHPSISPTA